VIDRTSPTWQAIQAWAAEQIAAAHKQNENLLLDDRQTAAVRSRIATLRDILALGEKGSNAIIEPSADYHV
jgi:hypothetical protein